jgi:hypothetical protein
LQRRGYQAAALASIPKPRNEKNGWAWLEKIELVRRFLRVLPGCAVIGDGAFVLLIGELQDM